MKIIDLSHWLFVFCVPVAHRVDPWATGRGLLAAIIGIATAWLGSNRSSRSRPLRDTA